MRCSYLSPVAYHDTLGTCQCTKEEGHEGNHNISEDDFFAFIGLPSRRDQKKAQDDNDAIALMTGFLG